MKKSWPLIFCFLTLFTTTLMAQEYTIGILAKRGTNGFYNRWLMHSAYLEKATGQTFVVKPLKFVDIAPAVASGTIDFLLTNPSIYVDMKIKHHIKALVTMVNHTEYGAKVSQFGAVIFTHASNSNINTLSDVKDKTFIAVKKTSLGGYQMAVKAFKDKGIELTTTVAKLQFANTHDEVVKAVFNQPASIGTVRSNILESMALTGAIKMKNIKILNQKNNTNFPYLISTALYPEWPLAVLTKTDPQIAQQVQEALIQMKTSDLPAELAGIAGWQKALDYNELETMLRSIGVLASTNTAQ